MANRSGIEECPKGPRFLAIFLLSLAACGPGRPEASDAESGPEDFSRRDSAGIDISTTSATTAWAPLPWDVDSLPDLMIGHGESLQQTLFQVEGVKGLPDGGVLVVDGSSRELRFYDGEGRLVDYAGGRGEGPGEFERPLYLPWAVSDSLLLWDRRLRRFQVFSVDGGTHRTVSLPDRNAVSGLVPVGAVDSRVLLREWDPFGVRQNGLLGKLGALEEGWQFSWLEMATGQRTPAADVTFFLLHGFPEGSTAIPFTVRPSIAVNQNGFFLTDGRAAEVLEIDLEGRPRRIFRIDGPRRPVTPEIFELHVEQTADLNSMVPRDYWQEAYAEMEIPDSLPAFEDLQVDESGWLWARVYHSDRDRVPEWLVFDREGRARGTVETPIGLEVRGIGRDFLLGVWRDDVGVEYVHRHRLERTGSSGVSGQLPYP